MRYSNDINVVTEVTDINVSMNVDMNHIMDKM